MLTVRIKNNNTITKFTLAFCLLFFFQIIQAQDCSLFGIDFSGIDVTPNFTDRAHTLPEGNVNISATQLGGQQPKGENNGDFRLRYKETEGGLKYQIDFSRAVYVVVRDELTNGFGHNTADDNTYFSASNGSWETNGVGIQNVNINGNEIDWLGEGTDFRVVTTEKVTSIIVESLDGNPWTAFNISIADCLSETCGNGFDDDGDGLTDCDDPDCANSCDLFSASVQATIETGQQGVASFNIFITSNATYQVSDITISDVMPSGFTYIGDTLILDDGGYFDSNAQPAYGSTGTLTWGNITMNPGETIAISYDAMIGQSVADATYSNAVTMTGGSFPGGTVAAFVTINSALTANAATFNCEPAFYQVYRKSGKNQPNVYGELDPISGDYTQIAIISHQANGLGFDVNNNLAYGAVGKEFVSLDDEGIVKTLGLTFNKKVYVGDMDTLGNWYGKDGNNIVKVDVSGPTLVAIYNGQGMPGWDMAYNTNGNFYAVHNGTLYKFDPNTNLKSTVGSVTGASIPNGGYGAQWTGKDGFLYISHNSTGEIYRIDVNTGEARFVLQSIGGLKYNDGFSCPLDIPAVYKYDHHDLAGYPAASHLAYAQDSGNDDVPDFKMVWLGTRVTEEDNTPANHVGNGDGGDDGIVYPSSYVAGGTADFGIILNTNMSDQEVFYGMWIDWDDDQTYDDFYNGSSTISGQTEVSQTVNVPANFATGDIAVRLRVGESAFVAADQGGDKLLGEVEDYLFQGNSLTLGLKEIAYIEINFECDAANNGVRVVNENLEEDRDSDGVKDKDDPDPNDPNRTFVQYQPAQSTKGTLAFEDLWPMTGDYDFNDFVVEVHEIVTTNASNEIYDIMFDLRITSMGGAFSNDFGIALLDPQNNLTVEVFSEHNVQHLLEHSSGNAIFTIRQPKQLFYPENMEDIINAVNGSTYFEPIEIQVVFSVNGALSYPNDYRPKFFIEQQGVDGHEIHLPGTDPTPRMDNALLGTVNDDTDPGTGKYFKTANNLPWALYIPTTWNYPLEGRDLTEAYEDFVTFAQQNSSLVWYQENQSDPDNTFNEHE
ncbi:MAG: LruC domain-containing protein [Bacteroidota bacterium]